MTHSLKEWLLLSQPPSCLSKITSFATLSRHSGALAVDLGSFPLAAGHYRSATVSQAASHRNSEFGWGRCAYSAPGPLQCSPSCGLIYCGYTYICLGEYTLTPTI